MLPDSSEWIYVTSNIISTPRGWYYLPDAKPIKQKKNIKKQKSPKSPKPIKLNKSNWLKYLSDYGWFPVDNEWKSKLSYFSNYGLLDCGGGGDCLFHCLAESLNDPQRPFDHHYDYQELRQLAAECITPENFKMILESYLASQELGEFEGEWEPRQIETLEQLQYEITTDGNNFWGDHIILQLLQHKLNINIIIMNSPSNTELSFSKLEIGYKLDPKKKTTILYYLDNIHFQLVGYFSQNRMHTHFEYSKLPSEFIKIFE